MSTLKLPLVRHSSTDDVASDISAWLERGEIISNESAAAIASCWQTPRGYGYAFALLASAGTIVPNDLRDSIRHELNACRDRRSQHELYALLEWLETVLEVTE